MLDDIKAQLTEISRNKLRSVLTIGGIVIGVMSVVIISAVGEIGRQTITSKLENMGIDSVMITASSETQGLDENDLEAVQCSGAVENAVPLIRQPGVDGLFIGRSAWDAENFNKIIRMVLQETA